MNEQSQTYQPCFLKTKQTYVNCYCPVTMKQMKIDTTSVGVKNRIGEHMVNID